MRLQSEFFYKKNVLNLLFRQYLIRGRTRELAITKLLSLCILQKDSIDGLIIFILEKYREICNLFKNRSFGLSIWHRKQTRLMSLLLVFVVKMELFEHITKEVSLFFDLLNLLF
jgi:hypothetical protein